MVGDKEIAPVAIDLFAGAGGLAEGLEMAGFDVVAAVELHPQPALTYAFNHPRTAVFVGDVRNVKPEVLSERVRQRTGSARVDLVVGGPPCQGFSTAGKKLHSDPRNNLFQYFIKMVSYLRPRMFLLENVPGFKKMYGGRAFNEAVARLSSIGYEVTDTILDAADYGVPQRRQRFIMVGWIPNCVARFSWPLPTHEESKGPEQLRLFSSGLLPYVKVAAALGDLAFLEPGWESHKHALAASTEYQQSRRNGCSLLFNHLATRHREKAVVMFSLIPEGGTISAVPAHLRNAKRTMARLDRNLISNAVLALPDDLIHYQHHRIPTVREMAWLQSFDDDYVFFGKRTSGFVERRVDVPQYTQVGNAVPPLLGRALGEAIIASLGSSAYDSRALDTRRKRHLLVRGSSGYAGYTLDDAAEEEILLESTHGGKLRLPISSEDIAVWSSPPLREWKAHPNPQRGQWAPGVKAPSGSTFEDTISNSTSFRQARVRRDVV